MADVQRELFAATLSKRAYQKRQAKLLRMRLLKGAITACFFAVILLLMAMLHLSRVVIREVAVEGNQYYSQEQLSLALSVKAGDGMYQFDREKVAQELLLACPYLDRADVKQAMSGTLTLHVSERTARWAIYYPADVTQDGTDVYVILDDALRALEYRTDAAQNCLVVCQGQALPKIGQTLINAADEADRAFVQWQKEQGDAAEDLPHPHYAEAAADLAQLLDNVAACYEDMTVADAPAMLDLSDAYDVKLILRDGTVFLLGSARSLRQDILRGHHALQIYRGEQGGLTEDQVLILDLRDQSQVLVTKKSRNDEKK